MPRGGIRPTCSIEGCDQPHKARSFCRYHYGKYRNEDKIDDRECSVNGCARPVRSKGMCNTHYQRVMRIGETETREDWGQRVSNRSYNTWRHMIWRCENPKDSSYKNYGARGIKVCDRWHRYLNFLEDMGEREENMTLERKDNNGDYCKENCRWATYKQQARNKRNNVLNRYKVKKILHLHASGVKQVKIAAIFGVTKTTISEIVRGTAWN